MAYDETGAQWKMALHLLFRMDEGQLFPDEPRNTAENRSCFPVPKANLYTISANQFATTDQALVPLWSYENIKCPQ